MRFGRKSTTASGEGTEGTGHVPEAPEASAESAGGGVPASASGPHDEADLDVEGAVEAGEYIDLGSLLVRPAGPMEMRLSVDEQSGEVVAAVLVDEQGALELRAFAAARGEDQWAEIRPQIAAETARLGGTATEQEGAFGPELLCLVPVQTPDGQPATQASRVIAHQGPRWLLRATLMGQPAVESAMAGAWEDTIRNTVVRRGREAMAPGTPLALRLPPQARRAE